jgi:hypothetical protein
MAVGYADLDTRVQKSQLGALRQSRLYQVAVTPLDKPIGYSRSENYQAA